MRISFLLITYLPAIFAKKLPDLYWNSTNPLMEFYAAIGDSVDIYCPHFDKDTDIEDTEQSIIFRVPEEDYENCRISSRAELLRRCVRPFKEERWTNSFRTFSPLPSALHYKPGQTYYFISTSTGSAKGLNNTIGGLCASHNLKMIIHVTSRDGDTRGHPIHHHRHHSHHHKTTTTTTAPEPRQWPESPEWPIFYEKIAKEPEYGWNRQNPSRPERVMLDYGNEKDAYQIPPGEDIIDFQIHEIGEMDSLYSSTSSSLIYTIIGSLLTMLLLHV